MSDQAEIVLPKGWKRVLARSLVMIGLTIGLLVLGFFVSLKGEDGSPRILSPGLAEVSRYRNFEMRWSLSLQDTQRQLTTLLENSTNTDMFGQYDQADGVYRRLADLLKEIDRTGVPETMEPLHELVQTAAFASMEGAEGVAHWLGEPAEKNHQAASEAVAKAQNNLNQLLNNPWVNLKNVP
jgi:hypothetical protein